MLRLFLRIASTRSFSETARLEYVSQPALSRTIRLLEEQLGVKVFDRDTRNVSLTPAGAQLVPTAERLIADYDLAFRDLAASFSGLSGRVAIGALPSVAAVLLPPALARFRAERPNVEIKVYDNLSEPLLQMLDQRRIDLAISIEPASSDEVAFEPLIFDECVLICRRGDPLDQPGPLAWTALEGERFVAMAPESSVRRMTDSAFQQAGVRVEPLYECAQLATVGGLVRAGLGVTALPATTLALMAPSDLVSRPLVPSITRAIGVVRLLSRSLPPAGDAFIDCFRRSMATA